MIIGNDDWKVESIKMQRLREYDRLELD